MMMDWAWAHQLCKRATSSRSTHRHTWGSLVRPRCHRTACKPWLTIQPLHPNMAPTHRALGPDLKLAWNTGRRKQCLGLMAQVEWRYAVLYRRGSPSIPVSLFYNVNYIHFCLQRQGAATEQDDANILHPQNGAGTEVVIANLHRSTAPSSSSCYRGTGRCRPMTWQMRPCILSMLMA